MALQFVAVLYAVFFATFLPFLADIIRKESPQDWGVRLALLIFMIMVWFVGPTIDGLEYEDAYVHLAAAKFQIAHLDAPSDGFYVLACVIGSTNDCVLTATYGTQLIGFSTLLTLLLKVGVPWPGLASIVSYIATTFMLQVTWTLLRRCAGLFPSCIGMCLLVTAPSLHVIAGTGFAEPLYTFLLMSWLLVGLAAQELPTQVGRLPMLMLLVGGLLMVVVKKEGILLVALMLLWSLWQLAFERSDRRGSATAISAVCGSVILISLYVFRIGDAEVRHGANIGASTFNLTYASQLLPIMLEAAWRPSFFGGLFIAGAFLAPIALMLRVRWSLAPLVVVACFIALYSLHARTIAFAHGASVEPAFMTRYLFTLLPLVAISSGAILDRLWARVSASIIGLPRGALWALASAAAVSVGAISFSEIGSQRTELFSDERQERWWPLQERDFGRVVIVTPYSLALYARGPVDLRIVSRGLSQTETGIGYLSSSASSGLQILRIEP